MLRVDFYVVSESGEVARQRFACRLAEKAYRQNNVVHIEVGDSASAIAMDQLLWTFRDGSFVPHNLIEPNDPVTDAPVTIGASVPGQRKPDLLINLTDALPNNLDSFVRVAEIVTSDEASKIRSRKLFAAYRDAGHTLETHTL